MPDTNQEKFQEWVYVAKHPAYNIGETAFRFLSDMKLRITVEELELEDQSDYLSVYDVHPDANTGGVSKKYTGNVRSTSLTTKNSFLLHFETDYSIEKKGFRITARTLIDKCGGYIRNHGATVQSPNYPNPYEPGLDCLWAIKAPVGFGIEIKFLKFEIRNSTNCKKDFVKVGTLTNMGRRKCGIREEPPLFEFRDKTINLKFMSDDDSNSTHKGFVFTVRFWPLGNLGGIETRQQKCGLQKVQPWSSGGDRSTERIVGGLEAISGSWPWMIHIPNVQCGGVLLNER